MLRIAAISLAALTSITSLIAGSSATHLVAIAPTSLVLEGTSNVSAWRCHSTTVDADMNVAAPVDRINAVIDRIEDGNVGVWMNNAADGKFPPPDFAMVIPVPALRCGNPVMERDMRQALLADRFPAIVFHFSELISGITHDIDHNTYAAIISGEITLAGAHKQIQLPVVAQRLARDRFRIQAELPLRMTDFGVRPPTALFGMVKARDELVVRFDLVLQVTP